MASLLHHSLCRDLTQLQRQTAPQTRPVVPARSNAQPTTLQQSPPPTTLYPTQHNNTQHTTTYQTTPDHTAAAVLYIPRLRPGYNAGGRAGSAGAGNFRMAMSQRHAFQPTKRDAGEGEGERGEKRGKGRGGGGSSRVTNPHIYIPNTSPCQTKPWTLQCAPGAASARVLSRACHLSLSPTPTFGAARANKALAAGR